MITVMVPYLSASYFDMVAQGWVHWCDYVENGEAMMTYNYNEEGQ